MKKELIIYSIPTTIIYLLSGYLIYSIDIPILQILWLLPCALIALSTSILITTAILILIIFFHPLTWTIALGIYIGNKLL